MLRDQIPRPGEGTGCGLMTSEHKGDYFVADVFRGKWIVTSRAVCEQQREYVLARGCTALFENVRDDLFELFAFFGEKETGPMGEEAAIQQRHEFGKGRQWC